MEGATARLPYICNVIEHAKADVVCLQEVYNSREVIDYLRRRFGGTHTIHVHEYDMRNKLCCLVTMTRLTASKTLLAISSQVLPSTSSFDSKTQIQRTVWGDITILNAHTPANTGARQRVAQHDLKHVARGAKKLIVCGDFNMFPTTRNGVSRAQIVGWMKESIPGLVIASDDAQSKRTGERAQGTFLTSPWEWKCFRLHQLQQKLGMDMATFAKAVQRRSIEFPADFKGDTKFWKREFDGAVGVANEIARHNDPIDLLAVRGFRNVHKTVVWDQVVGVSLKDFVEDITRNAPNTRKTVMEQFMFYPELIRHLGKDFGPDPVFLSDHFPIVCDLQ